ncbi:hypothetical protein BC829DRAFT_414265 [Chytridium lagenaria]|nr:hypothetical protein BC829DRAFT_414265 [Chytridium lagenaria]
MFTYEQTKELLPGLSKTFETLGKYPTFIFFDKACRFLPSVQNAIDDVENPMTAVLYRRLVEDVVWLVDKFHFRSHNDAKCKELYNPKIAKDAFNDIGSWNTQAAEQANAWLQRIAPVLRTTDPILHDFYLYSFVDTRNACMGV